MSETPKFDPDWPHDHVFCAGKERYPARLVDWRRVSRDGLCLVFMVKDKSGSEYAYYARPDGTLGASYFENAPVPKVKRSGWINIRPGDCDGVRAVGRIYRTKEDAEAYPGAIDTIEIHWEEDAP